MHAMGLHSALAIKRQRRRREEQKRARERRFSSQSTESGLGESRSSCASPRNSMGSLDRRKHHGQHRYRPPRAAQADKVVSGVGMLHIGVIFIVLGLFLIASGLIPDDFDNWSKNFVWFNELIVSGAASLVVGIFLCVLNKIISRKEEEDLAEYVSRQLTRSRSGHRLVRDVETGNLVSKKESKAPKEEKMNIIESEINGDLTPVHASPTLKSPPPLSVSTPRSDLERILEEELYDKNEHHDNRFSRENVTHAYTHHEELKRELITARYYNNLDMNEK